MTIRNQDDDDSVDLDHDDPQGVAHPDQELRKGPLLVLTTPSHKTEEEKMEI